MPLMRRNVKKIFRHVFQCVPFLIVCTLVLLLVAQWQRHKLLLANVKQVSETLTIYKQMLAYAEDACGTKKYVRAEQYLGVKGSLNAKVDLDVGFEELTAIFISEPNLICANDKLKYIREKYPFVQVILAFNGTELFPKRIDATSFPFLKKVVNLGGFHSYPEALSKSISIVKTKYFLLLDSELALEEMHVDFVRKLMENIRGFSVLGGSLIDHQNEFSIPCYRLTLKNWVFFEKYEYKTSGNVLSCEMPSFYFLADAKTFGSVLKVKKFDAAVGVMWWQDFFIQCRGLLEVGILPEVIFKKHLSKKCYLDTELEYPKSLSKIDSLLPFVNKFHILDFIDSQGSRTTMCDRSNPIVCSEKYVFPKWKLKHWAYSGLTAFPFILQHLIDALHFGAAHLEKKQVPYILEGGTLLGFIKLRGILPWDSGDVDTFVYTNRRTVIDLVKEIKGKNGYEYLLRWNAFHVYVTPYYPAHDGLIVFGVSRTRPEDFIRIKMYGRLFSAPRTLFKFIREHYGSSYLESRIRFGDERVSCDYDGYHACMPDCRWDGCGCGRQQFPGILH